MPEGSTVEGTAFHLVVGIAGTRQQALGFGSPVQLQAFGVTFNRVVDPSTLLGSVTSMEADIVKRQPWYGVPRI